MFNLNHREDKHLESLQNNISFLQKELLMKNEIINSLNETKTIVLDTISTSQRMLTVRKKSSDAPETPSNTTLVTYHQQYQQTATTTTTTRAPTATTTTATSEQQ